MKKVFCYSLVLCFRFIVFPTKAISQSLGLNNSSPNASAILDATSTTQGVLVPRMTTVQRAAISSPATGLLVYTTDRTVGFFYYNGSTWVSIYSPTSIIIKRKTVDESVSGTGGAGTQKTGTTLQDDDELTIPLQANQYYTVEGFLFMIAGSNSPDCKLAFTIPAGATMMLGYHANYGDNNTNIASDILTASGASSSAIPNNGAGKENPIFISGCVVTGAAGGNLTLQWAQNTNNNTYNTTIRANSFLRAMLAQ